MQWIQKLKKKAFVYWKDPFQCFALMYHPSWNRLDVSFLVSFQRCHWWWLMVLTCSPDDCATAGLKTGIWDVCSRISLLQLIEIKLGDIKISLLVECLGADSSAAVRWSWICARRVLRPLLAVVIILLRATAVWDSRAMGVSASEHGILPGTVSHT